MLLFAAAVRMWFYRRVVALERRAVQAERLAELGTLTGGLAHEIKNPLSTVQLNLQLLREDLDPDDPAYRRLVSRLDTVHARRRACATSSTTSCATPAGSSSTASRPS